MQSYKHIRNKVNKLNGDLKRDYFTQKITSCEGDLKNTWKTINQVINKKSKTTHIPSLNVDGKHIANNDDIAESMNNFFCSIGEKLSDKIPKTRNPLLEDEYNVNLQNTRFQFKFIDLFQIEKVFRKFKKFQFLAPFSFSCT